MSIFVMFHLMHEKIIFSSVRVAEWPPFGKEQLTLFVILVISRVGFEDGIWALIVPVPVSVTCHRVSRCCFFQLARGQKNKIIMW